MEVKSEQHITMQAIPMQIKSEDLEIEDKPQENVFPTTTNVTEKINKVAYVLINKNSIKAAYQDLTGRFL